MPQEARADSILQYFDLRESVIDVAIRLLVLHTGVVDFFAERIQIFDYVGDVYVIFECGHGVSNEANAAFARGACLVPVMRSGGASSGVFNFPAGALEKPSFATEEQWQLLSSKASPVANSAQAVVDLKWD